jgi:hypothetical protein
MESDSSSLPELSFKQCHGLLLELEEFAYPLLDLNLLEICNSLPNFYGAPASLKRRAFQKKIIGSSSRIRHTRPYLKNTTFS